MTEFIDHEQSTALSSKSLEDWLHKQRRRQTRLRWLYYLLYPLNRYLDFYLANYPKIFGTRDRLHLGHDVVLNNALINTVSGHVTIEDNAFLGHDVALLTGSHEISRQGLERQYSVPSKGRDIMIETGAWIGSGAIVLGPCCIGAHAVVGAGAVVTHDVPPKTFAAGNPARIIKQIEN